MRAYSKSIVSTIGTGLVAALCVPIISATAAAPPPVGEPTAGMWTKPETIGKGKSIEVLAPPIYRGFYGETVFLWRHDSVLSSRELGNRTERMASGVTAVAVSQTGLAWHQGQSQEQSQEQGREEGVHLRVIRTVGSSGGDPGWRQSYPVLVPDTYDPSATPLLAVADDNGAMTSTVVYSRTTPLGVELEAAAYSTGGASTTAVTVGATQVLATPGGNLDQLQAVHGEKLIAVTYRRTAPDGATTVVLRTSPVTRTINELLWGPEQVVCEAPADAAVACGDAIFGRDKARKAHLFLRGPDGLQHRTVSASGASEPVVLGPASGAIAVMDDADFYEKGKKPSTVDLSVAAVHGDETTVWRIRAAGPAVGASVRTPGVRLIALGQHGSGRMLAWSNGTGVGTWSDDQNRAVTRVASDVSGVTQLGMAEGRAPRIWYVAGTAGRQRLGTTLLDQRAPVVSRFRYYIGKRTPGLMKATYEVAVSDEGGLARTVFEVRSGPAARTLGKWRTMRTIDERGRFQWWHTGAFRVQRGFRYCMRIRSIDIVGRRSDWSQRGKHGKTTCVTAKRR